MPALAAVLLMAFGLRVWGIKWGIPQEPYWDTHHPDEKVGFSIVYDLADGDDGLNPHYFVNPSWHYYTLAFVNWLAGEVRIVPTLGQLAADEAELEDITKIWLVARALSVALGTATVLLVFLAAAKLFGSRLAGVLSAWLAAVNPVLVMQSHFITVDGPAVFWFMLAFWLLLLALEKEGLWPVMLAGAAGGLAAATKYTNLLILLPAAVAFVHQGARAGKSDAWRKPGAYIAGILAGFLMGCPYALLSPEEFWQGLSLMSAYNKYTIAPLFPWAVTSRLSLGWPLWAAFLASLAVSFHRPSRTSLMLSVPLVGLLLILGLRNSPYYRHLLPAVPLALMLTSGVFLGQLSWKPPRMKKALAVAAAAWLTMGAAFGLANSVAWDRVMAGRDTRDEAAGYLLRNYPPGSEVAVAGIYEFYSPNLDQYSINRLQYDLEAIWGNQSGPIVVSDFEREGLTFCKRAPGDVAYFFEYLDNNYRPRAVFSRVPSCCGLEFTGYPLADWRYTYPEITIYERRF